MRILDGLSTAYEIDRAKPALAFLPIGATEQHAGHLPVLTDTIQADFLSVILLKAIRRRGPAYLLPTIPISTSFENTGFRGTVTFGTQTMRGIVRDTYDSLARSGIRRLVVCTWHGGNFILKPVIREQNWELRRPAVLYLNPWEHVPAEAMRGFAPGFEAHAGDVETSLMLALYPSIVGKRRRDHPIPFQASWLDMHSLRTLSHGVGHAGHPARASAAKGRRFLKAMIGGAARALEGLLARAARLRRY